MNDIDNFSYTKDNIPSIINNPFIKDKITRINIVGYKSTFGDNWIYYSNIDFINNNTLGSQKINGNSMDEVYLKTSEFIKTLNNIEDEKI